MNTQKALKIKKKFQPQSSLSINTNNKYYFILPKLKNNILQHSDV